jgi:hypothetical protein
LLRRVWFAARSVGFSRKHRMFGQKAFWDHNWLVRLNVFDVQWPCGANTDGRRVVLIRENCAIVVVVAWAPEQQNTVQLKASGTIKHASR